MHEELHVDPQQIVFSLIRLSLLKRLSHLTLSDTNYISLSHHYHPPPSSTWMSDGRSHAQIQLVDDEAACDSVDQAEDASQPCDTSLVEARCYVFTCNNPSLTHEEFFKALVRVFPKCTGICMQLEKGREGTPHYQGVFQLSNKLKWTSVKNKMRSKNISSWVAPCRDPKAAIKYCGKEEGRQDGPWTWGKMTLENVKVARQRSDLHEVAESIAAGKSICEVATDHPTSFIKYYKGIRALKDVISNKERSWVTKLYVMWGPTGTGKSHAAQLNATKGGASAYYLNPPSALGQPVWWDLYSGEENVVIDDFYGTICLKEMLRLCDKYPHKVPIKGGTVQFLAKNIYITSNSNWELWYAKEFMANKEHKDAFERRITCSVNMTKRYVEPAAAAAAIVVEDDSDDAQLALVRRIAADNAAFYAQKHHVGFLPAITESQSEDLYDTDE